MNSESDGHQPKLGPEMASFKLLVLAFVRDYFGLMGASPSYGEIAAKLASNRERVRKAVKILERDGLLIRSPGPRGLRLPSMREQAVRLLREAGWSVDEDICLAVPPGVTKPPLLPPAALDYIQPRTEGYDGSEERARKAG
jgi:hypothetical protein